MRLIILILLCFYAETVRGQTQPEVDFVRVTAHVVPDTLQRSIDAKAAYEFQIKQKVGSLFLNAHEMEFSEVTLNGKPVSYDYDRNKIVVKYNFRTNSLYTLKLNYKVKPKQTLYFIGWGNRGIGESDRPNPQIWTQGQGKYTSYWLPSLDDMTDKMEFDLSISFAEKYRVLANGKLTRTETDSSGLKKWVFDMNRPMSSYLVAFAIGQYSEEKLNSDSGVPIYLYHYPDSVSYLNTTYRRTSEILDFLEHQTGVPYPWQNYKQIPVREFLYAGMENTGATLFSERYLTDSVGLNDWDYMNVNAHEMAHQWFGNLVTEASGQEHWLHEGFATYYAYGAEQHFKGDDYFYWKLYETASILEEQDLQEKGEALLAQGSSSLTYYEKGAWALVILKEQLGDDRFNRAITKYLENYAYGSVTVDQFLEVAEEVSGQSLSRFKENWLTSAQFDYDVALTYLKKYSAEIKDFDDLVGEIRKNGQFPIGRWPDLWNENRSSFFKAALISRYYVDLPEELLKDVFKTRDVQISKALLRVMNESRPWMNQHFMGWLDLPSYELRQQALFLSWNYNPEDRVNLLHTFEASSILHPETRMMWLVLAAFTEDFASLEQRRNFIHEFQKFTDSDYPMSTRQQAFSLLLQTGTWTDINLRQLVLDTTHHSWQFRNACRRIMDQLLEDESLKDRVKKIVEELGSENFSYVSEQLRAE